MAECGADMLSTGDSPAGLVGPELYRSFCLPAEQHVFKTLRESTDFKLSLHICGDATAILPDMAKSGADVVELDQSVDFQLADQRLPKDMAIWGNIDPVGVLLRGTPDDVLTAANGLLAQAASTNRRFVLSSGCTIAPDTPPGNVRALIRSTQAKLP
jgi:uroporphyrinogen-III decarboxylase